MIFGQTPFFKRIAKSKLVFAWNWIRGHRFYWVETPGTPGGGYWDMTDSTCPYPVRDDWSAKACIKAGDCGCVHAIAERVKEPASVR